MSSQLPLHRQRTQPLSALNTDAMRRDHRDPLEMAQLLLWSVLEFGLIRQQKNFVSVLIFLSARECLSVLND